MSLTPRPDELGESRPGPQDAGDVDLETLPKCPACGYIVYGAAEMRCSECGAELAGTDLLPDTSIRQEVDRVASTEWRQFWIGLGLIALGAVPILIVGWMLRPLSVCFVFPMFGATAVTLIFQKLAGNDLHPVMIPLGVIWVAAGLLFSVMVVT